MESILFAWAEPVDIDELTKVLGITKVRTISILETMRLDYEREESGLRLVCVNNTYQLSTKPENYDYISNFVSARNSKNISNAALETLAIVAYKQPVTKIEIEEIRGVKSDSTLKGLVDLGLIEITGTLDKIGRPNIYETTEEFLKKFGLSSIDELPPLKDDEQIKMTFLEE